MPLASPERRELLVRFRPFDSARLRGAILSDSDLTSLQSEYNLDLVETYTLSGAYRLRARGDPYGTLTRLRVDARVHDVELAPDTICPLGRPNDTRAAASRGS
jgi:hypothetical protein